MTTANKIIARYQALQANPKSNLNDWLEAFEDIGTLVAEIETRDQRIREFRDDMDAAKEKLADLESQLATARRDAMEECVKPLAFRRDEAKDRSGAFTTTDDADYWAGAHFASKEAVKIICDRAKLEEEK